MAAIGQGGTRHILVTGGAGFIGSNLVARLLEDPSSRVTVFDNLARCGVDHNLKWLQALPHHSRLAFVRGDIRCASEIFDAARAADEIYHLAAQVAVTTSVDQPLDDFEVNALGTINTLEAARRSGKRPFVFFTSTNKVYGSLETVGVHEHDHSYRAIDPHFHGATESTPLDFHSPYGCSKGAADQYVRDYARIYDLPTVVFRMSCIAGPRQFGNEDQGWVAHFLYSVLAGKPITIYGNGRQVRDILHVDDLCDAVLAARDKIHTTAGEIYNIGGGMTQSASVLEMLRMIERTAGKAPRLNYSAVRPGDQPLYVSNIEKLLAHTGWQPRRPLATILEDIHAFWRQHSGLIKDLTAHAANHRQSTTQPAPQELLAGEVA
jgi:CDP-paratose 2-epimerase